jgi:tellurite resistance protein TehA-like permease
MRSFLRLVLSLSGRFCRLGIVGFALSNDFIFRGSKDHVYVIFAVDGSCFFTWIYAVLGRFDKYLLPVIYSM